MDAKELVDLARQDYPNLPDAETLKLLEADEEFRYAVCEELNKSVTASDREFVLYLTDLYIKAHHGLLSESWENGLDPFRLCGLMLFKIGNVEDSVLLWQVKELDFDTFCGLDIQMLVGAGVDETIAYLKNLGDESAWKAAEYIQKCRESGDFDNIGNYVTECNRYFGYETAG